MREERDGMLVLTVARQRDRRYARLECPLGSSIDEPEVLAMLTRELDAGDWGGANSWVRYYRGKRTGAGSA